jgi:hypothetical protein
MIKIKIKGSHELDHLMIRWLNLPKNYRPSRNVSQIWNVLPYGDYHVRKKPGEVILFVEQEGKNIYAYTGPQLSVLLCYHCLTVKKQELKMSLDYLVATLSEIKKIPALTEQDLREAVINIRTHLMSIVSSTRPATREALRGYDLVLREVFNNLNPTRLLESEYVAVVAAIQSDYESILQAQSKFSSEVNSLLLNNNENAEPPQPEPESLPPVVEYNQGIDADAPPINPEVNPTVEPMEHVAEESSDAPEPESVKPQPSE